MKCPYCGSDNLNFLDVKIDGQNVNVVECDDCMIHFLPGLTSDENERSPIISKLKFGNNWD